MVPHRLADSVSVRPDGLSRREVLLRAGTGGLVLALAAHRIEAVAAQEATPEAGGMPAGVAILPGVTVPVSDMPAGGVNVAIYRVTLEAGSSVPVGTFPYPTLGLVEEGTLICPGGAPRYIIAPDGTTREIGAEEVPVNTGEAIYVPTNVPDGARNDGPGQVVILALDFMPAAEMATPTA